jgi:outer membrane protein assembly factor BamB/predicted phosphodiesterase
VRGASVTIVAVLLLAQSSQPGHAYTLHGVVFADANGDGIQGLGEAGVAGAVVAYGARTFVVADANGEFDLEVGGGGDNAWVRVPDGFVPGPVWQNTANVVGGTLAFGLRPTARHTGPLTFVVTSDAHITAAQPFANDLAAAARHAVALDPPPAFFAITGDVTQGDADAEFDLVTAQLADLGVPFIPVPGNHDWYDGGATWKRRYGPDDYSFDIGTVHFVVWNMSLDDATIQAYLAAELAHVDPAMTIVALSHAPPAPTTIETLRSLGVDYVLTGHTHTNRVVDHGAMREVNFEPFLMGGLDFTPAGYRVITIDAGKLSAYHRTTLDGPFLQLMSPGNGQCAAPTGDTAFAAAEIDASPITLTATIDGGDKITGTATGGWTFTLPIPALATGMHAMVVTATSASGATTSQTTMFPVCTLASPPMPTHDWPQVGGGPEHHGEGSAGLVPPLVPRWTQQVGGHILQAAPVIANGLVIETATDLGDDTTGGVVAIDLATGTQVWRTPAHARGGAAVSGSVVVVAQIDGTVLGLDLETGAILWSTALGSDASVQMPFIQGAPAVDDDGSVFIGNQHDFVKIDPTTGATSWNVDPIAIPWDFSTIDSMAIGGGLVVGSVSRTSGVVAWDRDTGAVVWPTPGTSATCTTTADCGANLECDNGACTVTEQVKAVNGSPIIDDASGTLFITDSEDDVTAYDLGTGARKWSQHLDSSAIDWDYVIEGGPALSNGVLVVPTLYGDLVALQASTGESMWRHTASTPSVLRTTHYKGSGMAGFEASPVITGNVVWAADTSGNLLALDLHTSAELWRTNLGAPVLASLAVADGWLVASTYDGTVHAWSLPYGAAVTDPLEPQDAGCCDTGGGGGRGGLVLAALVGLVVRRRRRL